MMSISKEQFVLHSNKSIAPISKDFRSDLRRVIDTPGRSHAGAPGRSLAGAPSRSMAGKQHKTLEEKCCPANNPVVRKLFFPKTLSIRYPDDNRVPTVNVDYSNFSTLKVGIDIPGSPYYLFLPSHNSGYFCVGGLTSGGKVRFLPSTLLPSSRDLKNYTYVRNLATRIGLRSGTVSSTNMALSGTFNACAFYSMRDFMKFDVSEFSTRCITANDYVQGVRSDNGVVLVSGPESVPPLRPLTTNELYSNDNSLNIITNFKGNITTKWNNIVIYDYLNDSSDLYGPLIDDKVITLFVDSTSTSMNDGKTAIFFLELQVTYASLKIDGSIDGKVFKRFLPVNGITNENQVSFSVTFSILPKMGVEWITYISLHFLGPKDTDTIDLNTRLNVPMQFSLGSLGPGFMVACVGFNKEQEIVTNVDRSIEAVPSGNLLPDKKADMSGYVTTKFKQAERAIAGFNTPGISIRRVYTRVDFYNFTISNCGNILPKPAAAPDLGNFDTEDRVMAGPISSVISGLSPFLSLIPGIGGLAAGIGNMVGGAANSLGFCGDNPTDCKGPNSDHLSTDIDLRADSDLRNFYEDTIELLPKSNNYWSPQLLNERIDLTCDSDCESTGSYDQYSHDCEIIQQWMDDVQASDLPVGYAIDLTDFNDASMNDCEIFLEDDEHTPVDQYSLTEVLNEVNKCLGNYKSAQRYALALMGAPILTEEFTISNVIGIDSHGVANVEVLIISDHPVQSYDGDGNNYDTPYHLATINLKHPEVENAVSFYVSEDFQPHIRGAGVNNALLVVAAALIYSGRGKARSVQYVTLPRPGLAAGPSLGISAVIQCLGIIDTYNVFSGGFSIRDGLPTVSKISGTFLKTTEASRMKMCLICSGEDSVNALLNRSAARPDGSLAYPYVAASSLPSGIPVNTVHAIVVFTILEALSIGHTLTVSRSILSATPSSLKAKSDATIRKRSLFENDIKAANEAGRLLLPEKFAELYGLSRTPLPNEVSETSFVDEAENAIDSLSNPNAVKNLRALLSRTIEKLSAGDNQGAYTGLDALAQNIASKRKKDSSAPSTSKSSGGFRIANTISERLAGRSRKRKGSELTSNLKEPAFGPKVLLGMPRGAEPAHMMTEEMPEIPQTSGLAVTTPRRTGPPRTAEIPRGVKVTGTSGTGPDLSAFKLRKKRG